MNEWSDFLSRAFQNLSDQVAVLLPRIVISLILLAAGIVVALVLQAVVRSLLRRSGLDRLTEQTGIGRLLSHMGQTDPASHLAGFVVFWSVLAVFLVTGADALGLPAVSAMIGGLIAKLPPIALAALVILFGLSGARAAQRTLEGVTERSRLASARQLGLAAYYLIAVLALVIALSGLGIDFTIVTAVVVVVLACVGAGVAVTLGGGSRDVARNTISGIYLRKEIHVGDRIRLAEVEGEVKAVGRIMVTLGREDRTWLVPYDHLLKGPIEIVRTPRP